MTEKIIPFEAVASRATELRDAGQRIVVTNGCFDLLHVGHVRYLQAAKAFGDVLIVGINGDESIRQLKGADRPINPERDRAEIVAALACVDYVSIFREVRAVGLLQRIKPAIYVKGGDYTLETLDPSERRVLEEIGASVRIIPFVRGYSTSALLAKLTQPRE